MLENWKITMIRKILGPSVWRTEVRYVNFKLFVFNLSRFKRGKCRPASAFSMHRYSGIKLRVPTKDQTSCSFLPTKKHLKSWIWCTIKKKNITVKKKQMFCGFFHDFGINGLIFNLDYIHKSMEFGVARSNTFHPRAKNTYNDRRKTHFSRINQP
jgi:hypothetical protein